MATEYQASGLHRVGCLVQQRDDEPEQVDPPGWSEGLPPGLSALVRPVRVRYPATEEIVRWREGLASRHRDRLGEALTWDEDSDFEDLVVVSDEDQSVLDYVAATIVDEGPQALRRLVGRADANRAEHRLARAAMERRGPDHRFRQLLRVEHFWLPFQRDAIIDDADWQGRETWLGSSFRLADELLELRGLIAEVDPSAAQSTSDRRAPADVLATAWQASGAIARVCLLANSHGVPFWTPR